MKKVCAKTQTTIRRILLLLMVLPTMILCACNVWPKELSPTPAPWPAELLPEGLPVPNSKVLSVGEIDGSIYIELKTNISLMKAYFGELEQQGYTIASYWPPSTASKDDVQIALEWHGSNQAGMKIWTGQEPLGYPKLAAFSDGKLGITLEENPTTGYVWNCVIEDESVVQFVGDKYISNEAPEGYTGVGGIHSFFFEGVRAGYTKIVFTQTRGGDDVFGKVVYKVTVSAEGIIAAGSRISEDY